MPQTFVKTSAGWAPLQTGQQGPVGPVGPSAPAEKLGAGWWSYGGSACPPNVETLINWNTWWWGYPEDNGYTYYANPDRFTVPAGAAGLHAVSVLLCFGSGAGPKGGWKSVRIYVNNELRHKQDYADTNQNYQYCEANTLLDLAVGDYVTVKAYHTGSGDVYIGDFNSGGCHFEIVKASGPKGDQGTPGTPATQQMYTWNNGGSSAQITTTSRARLPLSLVDAQTSKSDGTNADFILNPNKTIQIRTAGFYQINASIGMGGNPSAGQINSELALASDTTSTDPFFWSAFDFGWATIPASSDDTLIRHAVGRYFNAGDNIALIVGMQVINQWVQANHFSISRIGSGPAGPQGIKGDTGALGPAGGLAPVDWARYDIVATSVANNYAVMTPTFMRGSGEAAQFSISGNSIVVRDAGVYMINADLYTAPNTTRAGITISAERPGGGSDTWRNDGVVSTSSGSQGATAVAGGAAIMAAGGKITISGLSSAAGSYGVSGEVSVARLVQGSKGDTGSQGPIGGTAPYQIGQTWGIGGVLTAGMFVPNIFIPKRSNQSVTGVGIRAAINSGTSVVVTLTKNGAAQSPPITVTTTPSLTTLGNYVYADGDRVGLSISSPVGSPSDLSCTLLLEHQAT